MRLRLQCSLLALIHMRHDQMATLTVLHFLPSNHAMEYKDYCRDTQRRPQSTCSENLRLTGSLEESGSFEYCNVHDAARTAPWVGIRFQLPSLVQMRDTHTAVVEHSNFETGNWVLKGPVGDSETTTTQA